MTVPILCPQCFAEIVDGGLDMNHKRKCPLHPSNNDKRQEITVLELLRFFGVESVRVQHLKLLGLEADDTLPCRMEGQPMNPRLEPASGPRLRLSKSMWKGPRLKA